MKITARAFATTVAMAGLLAAGVARADDYPAPKPLNAESQAPNKGFSGSKGAKIAYMPPATESNYYIAIGDHRGPYYHDGTDTIWPCAESGVRMDWPTLYDKTSWIESTLGFSCVRAASGANAYMRCF